MADELTPLPPAGGISPGGGAPSGEPNVMQSVLIGAGVVFLISTIPGLSSINAICCLGVMLGAGVTVWHYTNTSGLSLTAGDGFKYGGLAGIIGGLASTIVTYLIILPFTGAGSAEVSAQLEQIRQQSPEVAEYLAPLMTGNMGAGLLIGVTLLTALIFGLFGGLGGSIATNIFKKGAPPSAQF